MDHNPVDEPKDQDGDQYMTNLEDGYQERYGKYN
jgi:hypothetical protein